jgi:hypothetical protein
LAASRVGASAVTVDIRTSLGERAETRLVRRSQDINSLDILCLGMYIFGSMSSAVTSPESASIARPADFYSAEG